MANTQSSVQIIPYYAQPHVHTVVKDNSWYEETVAHRIDTDNLPFATVAVIGADSGIDNTFVRLSDLATKQKLFGVGDYQKYGQPSLQADVLFNGSTNVWLCRVLPKNATYANVIFLAHYRKGKILDDLGQETGKYRMEIKFSTVSVDSKAMQGGPKTEDDIEAYARSLVSSNADPRTGYMTVPICYIRSIGRGQYGNNYSMSITRDIEAEKEFSTKMYMFNLISNNDITKASQIFSGSLYQTAVSGMSTLINDVLDQWSTGSCPVSIHSFEEYFDKLYRFYKEDIVAANLKYVQASGASAEDLDELRLANNVTESTFDPLFGIQMNSKTGEDYIPYYRNYTMKEDGPWVAPDLEIPNTAGASKPLNIKDWSTAHAGAKVLVAADPLNDGYRWLYTVISVDSKTGNIIYDEGVETEIDADQFDGIRLTQSIGHTFSGGHDGDFQEITVNGETRTPTEAEMKLLLSREYVNVFRGRKDRKILSPSRVNLDFIFDANYNMTENETLDIDSKTVPLYNNSTVITNKDAQALAILGNNGYQEKFDDINVKASMYDLNEFRNKNGMKINPERGAGCSLYLDCGLVGLKNIGVSYELSNIITSMEDFDGRATSIDLGYYEVLDPKTGRKVKVTVDYFIAKNLIPHIIREGLNKPFTFNYAQLTAIQIDTNKIVSGEMIRGSFAPDIDDIDWDVKEVLYKSRINYYITSEEGRVVQRAVQNTRQREASSLLEENNVRVLNTLKKKLEKACRGYLYQWNEPETRKGYTEAQMQIYRPWIGTMVKYLNIYFTANEFEQDRMIMHCYVDVEFRGIAKRITLEININKPDYSTTGGEN